MARQRAAQHRRRGARDAADPVSSWSQAGRSRAELLLCAMLDRAMRDYAGLYESHIRGTERQRIHAEAVRWFRARTQRPFSFRWICVQIGLDASYFWSHRARWLNHVRGQRG